MRNSIRRVEARNYTIGYVTGLQRWSCETLSVFRAEKRGNGWNEAVPYMYIVKIGWYEIIITLPGWLISGWHPEGWKNWFFYNFSQLLASYLVIVKIRNYSTDLWKRLNDICPSNIKTEFHLLMLEYKIIIFIYKKFTHTQP